MKQDLIIIKFGGSVVTDKSQITPTPRLQTITDLAKQLAQLYQSGKYQIILVHGTGSFGHPIAKKHGMEEAIPSSEKKAGYIKLVFSLMKLDHIIMEILVNNDLPAVSLPPHAFVTNEDRIMQPFDYSIIKKYLEEGLIPVLQGDPVLDSKIAFSSLSGDTIIPFLANKLKAKKVIFLSDVNGVFDKNPKENKDAQLIPLITNENFDQVLTGLTTHNPNDISGEMKGKILSIRQHLPGVEVIVASGLQTKVLDSLLHGDPIGTKLLLHS